MRECYKAFSGNVEDVGYSRCGDISGYIPCFSKNKDGIGTGKKIRLIEQFVQYNIGIN